MGIGMRLKSIYFNEKPLTEKDYRSSRTFSIFEGCTARTIYNLTYGAFLAGFASYLGADDSFNGVLGAVPVLAAIIQIISPVFFERMEKRKLMISILCLVHRLLLGSMVFIPFLARGKTSRLTLLILVYLLAYLAISFASPAASSWMIDLTPDNIRGSYFGKRESYVLFATTFFTLVMSRVLDSYEKMGHIYSGFIIMFSIVGILALVNFSFLLFMKEPPVKCNKSNLDIKKVIIIPLMDKKFRSIIFLFILWNIGSQLGAPFIAVYMVTGLKLNYTFIMVATTIGTLTNVVTVRIWGRIADKKTWIFVTKISILILSLTHCAWFFINSQTATILVPLLFIASGIGWAGIGISTFNIQFKYSPEIGKTVYVGFNAALSGLIGFLSTLAGSFVLTAMNGFHLNISGITIGNMQIIFALSGILLAVCVVYIHTSIKQPET
jgi:Major Facilitator Superfamily.